MFILYMQIGHLYRVKNKFIVFKFVVLNDMTDERTTSICVGGIVPINQRVKVIKIFVCTNILHKVFTWWRNLLI